MHSLGRPHRYQAVAGLALVAGLLGSSTTGGGGLDLGSLLGIGGSTTSTAAPSETQPGGHLRLDDQTLVKGCHYYDYSYAITVPPGDEFDLEIFLTDPHGTSQASDVVLSGADGYSGTKHLMICRSNTTPGTFTLHGTLYTNDGAGPTTTTRLADDRAQFTKAKKAKKAHHAKHHKKHKHKHKHKKRHH